jgi:hypothetical protein
MMPYIPLDTLQAMHRERFTDEAADRPASRRRDYHPDPLGRAWTRLRPGLRLRDGVAWLGRLGRLAVARPRRRTA